MTFTLSSSAFMQGEDIPMKYTCEGEGKSPPLEWSDPPEGTKSFVLIVDDPDAPDPAKPERVFVHWVVYDIPASAFCLWEGASPESMPEGSRAGANDRGTTGYIGPCPRVGKHRYYFRLYALREMFGDLGEVSKTDLLSAIDDNQLAMAELMGRYVKVKN